MKRVEGSYHTIPFWFNYVADIGLRNLQQYCSIQYKYISCYSLTTFCCILSVVAGIRLPTPDRRSADTLGCWCCDRPRPTTDDDDLRFVIDVARCDWPASSTDICVGSQHSTTAIHLHHRICRLQIIYTILPSYPLDSVSAICFHIGIEQQTSCRKNTH